MVQREGRILRQGNENNRVQIFRYVSEGSFDSYSWQILETKQRFISQFLSGSSYQRTISDLEDNVLTYAEVKALALSEPLMKQIAQTENEIKALRIIVTKEKADLKKMQAEIEILDGQITALIRRCDASRITMIKLPKYSKKDQQDCYRTLANVLDREFIFGSKTADNLTALCFSISLPEIQDDKKPYLLLCDEGESYPVKMGDSAAGNARRILNFITSFVKTREKIIYSYFELSQKKQKLEQTVNSPDESNQVKLRDRKKDLARLRAMLKNDL